MLKYKNLIRNIKSIFQYIFVLSFTFILSQEKLFHFFFFIAFSNHFFLIEKLVDVSFFFLFSSLSSLSLFCFLILLEFYSLSFLSFFLLSLLLTKFLCFLSTIIKQQIKILNQLFETISVISESFFLLFCYCSFFYNAPPTTDILNLVLSKLFNAQLKNRKRSVDLTFQLIKI